ncbi:MAG: pyridoxal phosphate-dependent aminotransferase [Pseudomonadota bacterium]|uniref:pyridoxal phosphate-dependent aminotransferase n=1 Tax=Phenylobacterium sp. TaxID=1871053 RepID=UPI00271796E4|nr:pyridoxal phosphate-dependent aminotransferase [Phenylobacterium sp.]MDO9433466.1 pyridoxal phosphate-dependent aminotransferase [Phenylobacterium sp.]
MRTQIVHPGADNLRYEIRQIVEVARAIEATGAAIRWENIGDPVAKGERVPDWIKQIVIQAAGEDLSFAYSPTKGLEEARNYIADERNLEGGIQITAEDILFFNGLGDAISTIYGALHPKARVIGPNPAYPTHSSAEAAHAGAPHITYRLDPENGWKPDLADLEAKVVANPDIAAIIIINPDNPTGFVYPEETLAAIVEIAARYGLFVISDEIYSNLAYRDSGMRKLASVIGKVPAIAMRGISKEFPWPGARCGWIEIYNRDQDANFDRFAKSLLEAKMLEVCATTLPQKVLPRVMGDERYYPYLETRVSTYDRRARRAVEVLGSLPEVIIHPARGAFYMTAVFRAGALRPDQSLPLAPQAQAIIGPQLGEALDARFVYYLLGATGICVVPLSTGFNSDLEGFRFTLLEPDEQKFEVILQDMREALVAYLASGARGNPASAQLAAVD